MITLTLSVTSVWMSETCWLTDSAAFSAITLSPSRPAAAVSACGNACRTGWVSCGLAKPIVMPLWPVVVPPVVAPPEDADVQAAAPRDTLAARMAIAPRLVYIRDLLTFANGILLALIQSA